MEELDLSLMFHNEQSLATIQSLLDAFESQFRVHVNLTVLSWATGHSELTREAIYGRGPDVSEIGSTWTSGLIAMNALRPFLAQEMAQIGKPEEFIPASWDTGRTPGDERMWAIPYTADIYLIYYRKDLLRKAGLDEAAAFQSHAQIDETVKRLKQIGIEMPILLPDDRHTLLHTLASWVWAQGGDFCSADGKQILFDQPESLAAMRAYFGLLRYLSADALSKAGPEKSIDLFCKGNSAIHFHDLPVMAPEQGMLPEVFENWGIAPFPKPYFMGGTNLVVWQHSPHVKAAVNLVQFMTSVTSMTKVVIPFRMLPPRLTVMSTPEFLEDPLLKNLRDAASAGRSYPSVKLWGVIEERLINTLFNIRSAALSDPQADLDALIREKIVPLAEKLNIALSQ